MESATKKPTIYDLSKPIILKNSNSDKLVYKVDTSNLRIMKSEVSSDATSKDMAKEYELPPFNNTNELVNTLTISIKENLRSGYVLHEVNGEQVPEEIEIKPIASNQSEYEKIRQEEIILPPDLVPENLKDYMAELGLQEVKSESGIFTVKGPKKMILKLKAKLYLHEANRQEEKNKQLQKEKKITVEVPISEYLMERLNNFIKELQGVQYEGKNGNKVVLIGPESEILRILQLMYNCENELNGTLFEPKPEEIKTETDSIKINDMLLGNLPKILDKMRELKITGKEKGTAYEITGPKSNLDLLKGYLMELENSIVASFYPPFWDFSIKDRIAVIKVDENSEEFKIVKNGIVEKNFHYKKVTLFELFRVQNNILMENYINVIKAKKLSRKEAEVNNRVHLVYHAADPLKTCMSEDTGIDVQNGKRGLFGSCLYFATDVITLNNSYFQFGIKESIIAEVFIGNVFYLNQNNNQTFTKAPEGFDCVCKGNIYGIFDNFYSYPLYYIKYISP